MDAYLYFRGNAAEARDFYARVFGGTVPYTGYWKDNKCEGMDTPKGKEDLIMHTTVQFGTNSLMMADSLEGEGVVGNNVTLCVSFEDLDKTTKVFNDLSEGGKIKMPLAPQFWGAHYGMLQDKFGVIWGFNCQVKEEEKKVGSPKVTSPKKVSSPKATSPKGETPSKKQKV